MSDSERAVTELLDQAFPASTAEDGDRLPTFEVLSMSDANQGRGVFSEVIRAELVWDRSTGDDNRREATSNKQSAPLPAEPSSVVVKLPASGINGQTAAAMGAYRREALAYREILPLSPVAFPLPHLVAQDGDDASFVLQDLRDHRMVDQLDGLAAEDANAVADELGRFHRHWLDNPALAALDVRRSTPAGIDPQALEVGLSLLDHRWGETLDERQIEAFRGLVDNRQTLVDEFVKQGPPTLCHGDPRADNLAFSPDGRAVLYDWQQLAVQFGAADLAWLAATSLPSPLRRNLDQDLVDAYGTTMAAYRLGLVLPGMAVLLLCQRELTDERSRRFVATSLSRIASALVDLDVQGARAESPRG